MTTTRKKNTFRGLEQNIFGGLECYETQKLQQYAFIVKNILMLFLKERNVINVICFKNMTNIKKRGNSNVKKKIL